MNYDSKFNFNFDNKAPLMGKFCLFDIDRLPPGFFLIVFSIFGESLKAVKIAFPIDWLALECGENDDGLRRRKSRLADDSIIKARHPLSASDTPASIY